MDTRSVTTTGHGTGHAAPDAVSVTLTIEVEGATPAEALRACGAVQADVLQALGAPARAAGASVRPSWDPERNRPGRPQATSTVTALLPALASAGDVVTQALEAGGKCVRLESMEAVVSDPAAGTAQAQRAAVAAARASAETFVAVTGGTLGRVLNLSEGAQSARPQGWFAASARVADYKVADGAQELTAAVTVTWELLD